MTLRKVRFDEELGFLVDEQGERYEGKRFTAVSTNSNLGGFSSRKSAAFDAEQNLETLAQKAGADAYEVISRHEHDTKQEYDSSPYTASAVALLYGRA